MPYLPFLIELYVNFRAFLIFSIKSLFSFFIRFASNAAENVHPVPCRFSVFINGVFKISIFPLKFIMLLPFRCPPVIITLQ